MDSFQSETIATLRDLTLQIMLISAGVFGIVGGFVSSTEKKFVRRGWLAAALGMFAISALFGYLLHGVLISLLAAKAFDPFNSSLILFGVIQIGLFLLGGICFTVFVTANVSRGP
jgi:hypothetical protein